MSWRSFLSAWVGVSCLAACPQGSGDSLDEPSSATASESSSSTTGETGGDGDPDPPATTSTTTSASGEDSLSTTGTSTTTTTTTTTTSTSSGPTTDGAPIPVCGNGIVEDDEACDEGDANADDGTCTLACELPKCGDGFLQPESGEECDDGPENSNENHCTKLCTIAKCGDALIELGVEECDDGDDNNGSKYNGCVPGVCTLGPHCGDGVLQPDDEECDDGEENGPAKPCSESCTWTGKMIFVTSAYFKGNLGGISGADSKCQALAAAAGLANAPAFLAWLSIDGTSPASRMIKSDKRYILRSGAVVAENWQDLIDSALSNAVDVTEKQGIVDAEVPAVWTGTLPSGGLKDAMSTCKGWTSDDKEDQGVRGIAKSKTTEWTDTGAYPCSLNARLYCIEQ